MSYLRLVLLLGQFDTIPFSFELLIPNETRPGVAYANCCVPKSIAFATPQHITTGPRLPII